MNMILAGDYTGYIHVHLTKGLYIEGKKGKGPKQKYFLNKENVASFEVMDEESHKSASSGVARGLVGAAVFGPIGAIAGAASAKNKTQYKVSITFKDGTRSLLSLERGYYEDLVRELY